MNLNAGPVQVLYENGFLRYLKIGRTEVVRMIYFAVRDHNWNTISGIISDEAIDHTADSFRITYSRTNSSGDISINWKVTITGSSDGAISFSIDGVAQSSFLKNRIGICVLHPIKHTAGHACNLQHVDGSLSVNQFPGFVTPHQPFKNIKSMQWQAGKKSEVRLDFDGEIFETEDQRNWTDASYKTYSTPLDLPFPALVETGQTFKQNVTFSIIQKGFVSNDHSEDEIFFDLRGEVTPFPVVGIGINPGIAKLQSDETEFFKALVLNHLRADIHLNNPKWHNEAEKALEQTALLEIPLALSLYISKSCELELPWLVEFLQDVPFGIISVAIFDEDLRRTTDQLIQKTAAMIRSYLPGTKVGGGSDANFAELNRNRISDDELDFVVFAMNPQVHASDNLTLIENMPGAGYAVNTAQYFAKDREIYISPVTLKPRFNAVSLVKQDNLPASDWRQNTSFVAGWTLGTLKYLAEAGAKSITFFETTGERGLCSGNNIYPVGNLLKLILQFKADSVLTLSCNYPLKITGLFLQKKQNKLLVLANHTLTEQSVLLPGNFKAETYQLITDQPGLHEKHISGTNRFVLLQPESVMALEGF